MWASYFAEFYPYFHSTAKDIGVTDVTFQGMFLQHFKIKERGYSSVTKCLFGMPRL